MKKIVSILVPVIFAVIGIALIVNHALEAQSVSRSNDWSQARGTIEKAAEGPENTLDVAFKYEYGGREYQSTVATLGTLRKSDIAPRLQRYQVGRTMLIYVNPVNPAEAVLELSQQPPKWKVMTGWGFIYLAVAVALVLWRLSSRPKRRKRRRPGRPSSITLS